MKFKAQLLPRHGGYAGCFFALTGGFLLLLMMIVTKQPVLTPRADMETAPPPVAQSDWREKPWCNFHIFKQYVSGHPFFPAGGKWTWKEGLPSHFKPKLCVFREGELSPTFLSKCLLQKRVARLLMLGDSNGKRHSLGLSSVLSKSGFVCNITKAERASPSREPDIRYYMNGTTLSFESFRIGSRACHTCTSGAVSCVQSTAHQDVHLDVEFLSMEFYQDRELTTVDAVSKRNKSETTQEFYFKEYLHGNYPDVIFLFGNNHLNSVRLGPNKRYIQELGKLLERNVPTSTFVVWIPSGPEYRLKKPKKRQNAKYENGKYNIEEYIRVVNGVVFNKLKPLMVRERSNFLPFIDLQGMVGKTKALKTLSLDGVHMQQVWYELITSYLLQTLCESDLDLLAGPVRRN